MTENDDHQYENNRDYLGMWRSESLVYYLTEESIVVAKYRSNAASFVPVIGGVLNSQMSKRASKQLRYLTVEDLRKDGSIVREILWKDVTTASLYGRKLDVRSDYGKIVCRFAVKPKKSQFIRALINIMIYFTEGRFTTDLDIPADLKQRVETFLEKLREGGTYQPVKRDQVAEASKEFPENNSEQKNEEKSTVTLPPASDAEEPSQVPENQVASGEEQMIYPEKENNETTREQQDSGFSRKRIFAIAAAIIVILAVFVVIETLPHAGSPANTSTSPISTGTKTTLNSVGEFWAWQLSGPTNGSVQELPAGHYTISDNESQNIYVIMSNIPLPAASAGQVPSSITNSSYITYMKQGSISINLSSAMYVSLLFISIGETITIQSGSTLWSATTYGGVIGSHGSGGSNYITVWTNPSANGLCTEIVSYSCSGVGSGISVGQTGFIVSGANTCSGDRIQ